MRKEVIKFYESVVSCANTQEQCPDTINNIKKGCPPRGFLTCGTPGAIDIMIVGKNPGHLLENEDDVYLDKTPREIAEGILSTPAWEIEADPDAYRPFHRNLMRYVQYFLDIEEQEVFKRCVYTNLVKCSTEHERQILKIKTKSECFSKYLSDEINYWSPKVLLALGREVENYLCKADISKQHGTPVIYIKHPSYFYKKADEKKILKSIKSTIHKYL